MPFLVDCNPYHCLIMIRIMIILAIIMIIVIVIVTNVKTIV